MKSKFKTISGHISGLDEKMNNMSDNGWEFLCIVELENGYVAALFRSQTL